MRGWLCCCVRTPLDSAPAPGGAGALTPAGVSDDGTRMSTSRSRSCRESKPRAPSERSDPTLSGEPPPPALDAAGADARVVAVDDDTATAEAAGAALVRPTTVVEAATVTVEVATVTAAGKGTRGAPCKAVSAGPALAEVTAGVGERPPLLPLASAPSSNCTEPRRTGGGGDARAAAAAAVSSGARGCNAGPPAPVASSPPAVAKVTDDAWGTLAGGASLVGLC